MINSDTALGQQLLDIPVGQALPQVPADRDRNHLLQEPETSKDRAVPGALTRPVSSRPRSANPTVPVDGLINEYKNAG